MHELSGLLIGLIAVGYRRPVVGVVAQVAFNCIFVVNPHRRQAGQRCANSRVMFGKILFPLVSIGVALALFEGALTLHFSDIRGHGSTVTNLVRWGAVSNWLLIAGGTWAFTDFSWWMALRFGALVVTGPAVVVPRCVRFDRSRR